MKQKRKARLVTVWVDGKMSRFRKEEGLAVQLSRVRRIECGLREDCGQGMRGQREEFQEAPSTEISGWGPREVLEMRRNSQV